MSSHRAQRTVVWLAEFALATLLTYLIGYKWFSFDHSALIAISIGSGMAISLFLISVYGGTAPPADTD